MAVQGFHDVRLREDVERGSQGGPGFLTIIQELSSGHEQRNIAWAKARGRWNVSYGIQYMDEDSAPFTMREIYNFFLLRQGRAFGFRFKDWFDFEMARQSIGTGDGSDPTWQIFKRYTDSAATYDRNITRPVTTTVNVWVNNVLRTEGVHYTVNYETGIITFSSIPSVGENIEVECEFDVPVRFDTDKFTMTWETFQAGAVQPLEIVELRV